MDLDRAAWFMAGLFIGNFLDTFTTVTLLFIWVVVRNQALPLCLGGFYPQNVLANFFQLLNIWVSSIIPSRIFPNKSNSKNLSSHISTNPLMQDKNGLTGNAIPKARIEEIDESEQTTSQITQISRINYRQDPLNRQLVERINPPKPITLLVRQVEAPQQINYTSRPYQLVTPPIINLPIPTNYVQPKNVKLKLVY